MASASPAARLLIVDDEPMVCDLLTTFLRQQGYRCQSCHNAEQALARLAAEAFDLVISDLNMPGRSGLELLEAVRQLQPNVAFLMATASNDAQHAVTALRAGAVDYLVKPLELKRVLAAVREALERRQQDVVSERQRQEMEAQLADRTLQLNQALRKLQLASVETLEAMAMALDVRASEMSGHSVRVGRYAVALASRLGYDETSLARLAHASWLHDIGKLGIPDAILNKPGPLTAAEAAIMRSHVQIGYELVLQVPSLAPAAELVLAHQERYDGTGYPDGLAGEAIPRDARVFAVADALDAMTSDRPYRQAMSWEEAGAEITAQSGRHFDPEVVDAFLALPLERWKALRDLPLSRSAAARAS